MSVSDFLLKRQQERDAVLESVPTEFREFLKDIALDARGNDGHDEILSYLRDLVTDFNVALDNYNAYNGYHASYC